MAAAPDLSVRQLAYYVPDIVDAARAHSQQFGSGPFFTFENVPLLSNSHRGVERAWNHSSAYGQWGDVMVEFVTQHSADPSVIFDIYPAGSGRYGLHHTACFVDNLDEAIARFEVAGLPLAQISETTTGTRFAFVDASATLGHMIELYAKDAGIEEFYWMVKDAARDWDGSDPVRPLAL